MLDIIAVSRVTRWTQDSFSGQVKKAVCGVKNNCLSDLVFIGALGVYEQVSPVLTERLHDARNNFEDRDS